MESLNVETKRIIMDEGHYTEANYPFKFKPNFITLGSLFEVKPQGSIIGFVFDESFGRLLGFNETIIWEEYKLSPNPVDILSFDNSNAILLKEGSFREDEVALFTISRWLLILLINTSKIFDLGYNGI